MTFKRLFAALAAAPLLLAACVGDIGSADRGGSSGSSGKLRFVNATQLALLDFYEGSNTLQANIAGYEVSSYSSLSVGTHTIGLRENGKTTPLTTASTSIGRDDHQSLVAYTTGTGATAATATAVLVESEPLPAKNRAKLRVFDTADAAAGAVDVFVVTSTCAVSAAGTNPASASSVSGLQAAYVEVNSSTTPYRICVTKAGTRTDVLLDIESVAFSDQRIVTLVLARTAAGAFKSAVLEQPPA